MGKKEQKVWKYLLKNKLATPTEVAKATGVSYGYVNQLMKRHAQVSLKSRTCGISFLIALCSATMKQEHLCPKHKLNY